MTNQKQLSPPLLAREGWISLALLTACKMRLFDEIEVSKVLSGLEKFKQSIVKALAWGGYVQLTDDDFVFCTDWTRKFLLSSSKYCIHDYVSLVQYQWEHYAKMPQLASKGQWMGFHEPMLNSHDYIKSYQQGLRSLSIPAAEVVATQFGNTAISKIVDLGCGHALQSLSLLNKHPQATLSLVDNSEVIDYLDSSQKVKTAQIKKHRADIFSFRGRTNDYDFVLLCNVIHLYIDSQIKQLFHHIKRNLLKTDGYLLIQEFGSIDQEETTEFQDLFAVYLYLHTGSISPQARRFKDVSSILLDCGFQPKWRQDLDSATPMYISLWSV